MNTDPKKIENTLTVLFNAYKKCQNELEKTRIQQLYNIFLNDLEKSNSENKEYYRTLIQNKKSKEEKPTETTEKGLKIKSIKRSNKIDLNNLGKKFIATTLSVEENNDLDFEKLMNIAYQKIKNKMLKGISQDGEIPINYKKNRLISILLNSKVNLKRNSKYSNISYNDNVKQIDEIIEKGLRNIK